ncbi:hypothetical protein QUC31_005949 [Theobroma cacao]
MGGIGKTTLAKLVYNDNRANNYFDLKAWVCVSEIFDIMDITKSILLSVGPEYGIDQYDLNKLQTKLKKKLSGKKLLLILDDLWHQIYNDWVDLQAPFGIGTTIIVTTRDQSVSSMARTIPIEHKLQKLSDEDCLSILSHHALGAKDFSRHLNLEEIGGKIVKKCKGLPLAAKTIGGLLKNKVDLDIIKTKDDVLSIEFLEDNIRISRQMVWEITVNVKTESLDNWKAIWGLHDLWDNVDVYNPGKDFNPYFNSALRQRKSDELAEGISNSLFRDGYYSEDAFGSDDDASEYYDSGDGYYSEDASGSDDDASEHYEAGDGSNSEDCDLGDDYNSEDDSGSDDYDSQDGASENNSAEQQN